MVTDWYTDEIFGLPGIARIQTPSNFLLRRHLPFRSLIRYPYGMTLAQHQFGQGLAQDDLRGGFLGNHQLRSQLTFIIYP